MLTFQELKKGLLESRWTRLAVISIVLQCFLVIIFESITYTIHRVEINHIKIYGEDVDILLISTSNSTLDIDTARAAQNQAFKNAESLSVYHILFMVAQIFTVLVQFDAIMAKNTMQLIAVAFFEFCMSIYSGVQYRQADVLLNNDGVSMIKKSLGPGNYHNSAWSEVVVIVVMVASSFTQAVLTWRLFQEFGWSIYKKIGADLVMRDMFRWYQVFLMLLKFDVFFFLGFSFQYLFILRTYAGYRASTDIPSVNIVEHITLSLLVTMIMLVLAFWGVISERTPVMLMFMVCGAGSLIYFIYSIVNVNKYGSSPSSPFVGAQIFLSFFLAVCIVLIVLTLIVSYFCLRNFGKGLKFHVKHENQELPESVHLDGVNATGQYVHRETKDRRWSIE